MQELPYGSRPTRFTLSPVGEWKIVHKGVNWGGGFGTRWLGLNVPWGIYGIHGTNKPSSIGTRASAGCIRMQNRDVEELFEWVSIGTPVRILGDPPSHLEFSRHLRAPLSGSDVVFVQLQLHHLGFDPQGADGRFGKTPRAVRELQEAFGLPVDGTVYDDVYYIWACARRPREDADELPKESVGLDRPTSRGRGTLWRGRYYYLWQKRLLRVGDVAIDPLRAIEPTVAYDVLVWEYDLYIPGVNPELRRAALEAAAAELQELHPNIRIRFEWFEGSPSAERLLEALEAGVGPDIAALAGGAVLVDTAYQVPVTPYMQAATREDLLPAVAAAVGSGEHLWVWPRWIDMTVWVGRAASVRELADRPALGVDELLQLRQTWHAPGSSGSPVVYQVYDPALFLAVAVGITGRSLLTSDGALAWNNDEIARACFQNGLRRSSFTGTPTRSPAPGYAVSMKEAHLMGPVNRTLLHHVLSRFGDLTHDAERIAPPEGTAEVAILSAPLPDGRLLGQYGTVASYAVFRRTDHAGDDHTQAVMQVAQHLSRRMGYWEAANLLAVPPYASSLTSWSRDAGLIQEQAEALIVLAERLAAPPSTLIGP